MLKARLAPLTRFRTDGFNDKDTDRVRDEREIFTVEQHEDYEERYRIRSGSLAGCWVFKNETILVSKPTIIIAGG